MTERHGKPQRKSPEKDGRGRRVSEPVRKIIRQTYLTLVGEGKTGRETSASEIEQRIIKSYPAEITESLPTWQSINAIVKPMRDKLQDQSFLDTSWSLSLWMRERHGISRDDLPIILEVQKSTAVDIKKRISTGQLRDNRLSIREARWVGPVYEVIAKRKNAKVDADAITASDENPIITPLIEFVRRYALRERVIELIDESGDSYDIDMELVWKDPGRTSDAPHPQDFLLYQEMGLIPAAPTMLHGEDFRAAEALIEGQDPGPQELANLAIGGVNDRDGTMLWVMGKILRAGIPVNVRFGTEDWNNVVFEGRYPNIYPLYPTSTNYDVDAELLKPIWELKKSEGEVVDSDPQPVKVATAFWVKIKERIKEMFNDPSPKNIETRDQVEQALRG